MSEQAGIHAKEKIARISSNAASGIKHVILEEAQRLGVKFPKMILGVCDEKPRKSHVVTGMLGSVDATVHAVATEMPGIVLFKDDTFWTEASVVILTPEGIFKCHYVMSEPVDAEKQKRNGSSFSVRPQPDWKYRIESPFLWVQYGENAIEKLSLVK